MPKSVHNVYEECTAVRRLDGIAEIPRFHENKVDGVLFHYTCLIALLLCLSHLPLTPVRISVESLRRMKEYFTEECVGG